MIWVNNDASTPQTFGERIFFPFQLKHRFTFLSVRVCKCFSHLIDMVKIG